MPKTQTSTQRFTEIDKIAEDIVLFTNGNACIVIEVSPTNFSLLSKEEQDSRVFAYASFLNSLTFPIQILINNKRVDISSYITLIAQELHQAKNPQVVHYMEQYKAFVENLVKQNIVLDKRFYITVPYSYLEKGALQTLGLAPSKSSGSDLLPEIKATLHTKSEGLITQLSRIGLQTKVLEEKELTSLFHQMYNEATVSSAGEEHSATTLQTDNEHKQKGI